MLAKVAMPLLKESKWNKQFKNKVYRPDALQIKLKENRDMNRRLGTIGGWNHFVALTVLEAYDRRVKSTNSL